VKEGIRSRLRQLECSPKIRQRPSSGDLEQARSTHASADTHGDDDVPRLAASSASINADADTPSMASRIA
jgi:hypothetical protein